MLVVPIRPAVNRTPIIFLIPSITPNRPTPPRVRHQRKYLPPVLPYFLQCFLQRLNRHIDLHRNPPDNLVGNPTDDQVVNLVGNLLESLVVIRLDNQVDNR